MTTLELLTVGGLIGFVLSNLDLPIEWGRVIIGWIADRVRSVMSRDG